MEGFFVDIVDEDLENAVNACEDFLFGAAGIGVNWAIEDDMSDSADDETDSDSGLDCDEYYKPPVPAKLETAMNAVSSNASDLHICNSNNKFHRFCEDISKEQQLSIRKWYRDAKPAERRNFLTSHIKLKEPKRRVSKGVRPKNFSAEYSLPQSKTSSVKVCQKKFVSTLGYTSNQVVKTWFKCLNDVGSTSTVHYQGRARIDRGVIVEHVESFMPQISHYHRANASKVRYLPRFLTIHDMYLDFITQKGGK